MARRQELNQKLIEILGLGSDHVYYNPPETIKLRYPCIIYNPTNKQTLMADNDTYRSINQYQLTIIDRNPDSEIVDNVINAFQYCTMERWFVYDELNQWVLRLFY